MTNSRSTASTSRVLALVIACTVALIGHGPGGLRAAHAGGRKRVVVLDFEGPRGEKFHDDLVKLIKKTHTVVPTEKWNGTAEQLDAGTVSDRNVKKVARKLKIDAIVEGKIEKRRDEFIIRIKLREGKSGEPIGDAIDTKAEGPRIDGRAQRDLKDELLGAIDNVATNHLSGGDDEDDDRGDSKAVAKKPAGKKLVPEEDEDRPARKPAGKKPAADDDDDSKVAARKPAGKKPAADDADDDRPARRSAFSRRSDDERGGDKVGDRRSGKKPAASDDDDDKPPPRKAAVASAGKKPAASDDDDDKLPPRKAAVASAGKRPAASDDDDDKLPPRKTAAASAGKKPAASDDDKLPPKKTAVASAGKKPAAADDDDDKLPPRKPAVASASKKPAASDDDDDKLPPRKPAARPASDDAKPRSRQVASRDDDTAGEADAEADTAAPLEAAAALAPGERAIDAVAGLSVTMRRMNFSVSPTLRATPPGYRGTPVAGAMLDATVYPLALDHKRSDQLKNVGLELLYDRVLKLSSKDPMTGMTYSSIESRFWLTGVFRHAFGKGAAAPVVIGSLGYGRQSFNILGTVDIPDVKYQMIAPGAGLRYPVTPRLILAADTRLLLVVSAGQIQDGNQYGAASVLGFEGGAGADYLFKPNLFVRAALRFETIGLSFKGTGFQSTSRDGNPMTVDVFGARDSYFGGLVTVGYLY